MAPAGRTDAGYRLYDETSLERLRFIARAKQLGCSLDEIADLVTAWDGGRCAPVQDRLRTTVEVKVNTPETRRRRPAPRVRTGHRRHRDRTARRRRAGMLPVLPLRPRHRRPGRRPRGARPAGRRARARRPVRDRGRLTAVRTPDRRSGLGVLGGRSRRVRGLLRRSDHRVAGCHRRRHVARRRRLRCRRGDRRAGRRGRPPASAAPPAAAVRARNRSRADRRPVRKAP